jgi:hypothetical protein
MFKHLSLFICLISFGGSLFIVKLFTKKFMKIKCSFCSFETFGNHFKIKLSMHGPILSLRYVSMTVGMFFFVERGFDK